MDQMRLRHWRLGRAVGTLRTTLVVAMAVIPCAVARAGSSVRFVDELAKAGGDGISWDTAYTDLQDALDDAAMPGGTVDEVWISAGTYRPDRGTGDPHGPDKSPHEKATQRPPTSEPA